MSFPVDLLEGFQSQTHSTLHLFVAQTVRVALHRLSDLHKVPCYEAVGLNLTSAHRSSKARFLMICMTLREQADETSWAEKQNQPGKGRE